jgi:hypothetical protein
MLTAKLPVDEQNCFVVEQPLPSYFDQCVSSMNVGFNGTSRTKIYFPRWKHIMTIHIIEASREQLYYAQRLDIPHYQITASERENFRSRAERAGLDVTIYENNVNYVDENDQGGDFLKVVNNIDEIPRLAKIWKAIDVGRVSELIEKLGGTSDSDGRGNDSVDVGFSGRQNVGPSKDCCGAETLENEQPFE